ncbi:hypothetical protein CCAX7_46540 [Capsulimonas corticalis]|uniref:Uncharacterized protein n=1 Tax=Capsulimonas corticalis TaxID=2219043 RepID=A0A402D4Y6_9BACT|nr:hypothetical protein [Capsulimonas corticalis]BDI32603.1 hypothetical protein CCAX7_46540 [Capsulimonas corticalis]
MSYADSPDPQFDEALTLLANDKQSNRLVKEIYLPSLKAFNATQAVAASLNKGLSGDVPFRVLTEFQFFFLHLTTFAATGRISESAFDALFSDAAMKLAYISAAAMAPNFAPTVLSHYQDIFISGYDAADIAYDRANRPGLSRTKANDQLLETATVRIANACGFVTNAVARYKIRRILDAICPTLDLYGAIEKRELVVTS